MNEYSLMPQRRRTLQSVRAAIEHRQLSAVELTLLLRHRLRTKRYLVLVDETPLRVHSPGTGLRNAGD